jgi:hypothetical protein
MIDAAAKLKCVKREIAMRRIAYPKWVAAGRMTQLQAELEIMTMEAIAKDYEADIDFESKQGKLI